MAEKERLVFKEDCTIVRGESQFADLYDCDGERLFQFPATWTDDQIMRAVDFANKAYGLGFENGEESQAAKMRAALRIAP